MRKFLLAFLCIALGWQVLAEANPSDDLLSAADQGDVAKAGAALKHGADPNAANEDGNTLTALMLASRNGNHALVKLLLDAGANVAATGSYGNNSGVSMDITALALAARSGNAPTVELLLSHKANPNARSKFESYDAKGEVVESMSSPMILNAATTPVLRLLVEHGADVKAVNSDGKSSLMYAAESLDVDAINYLLSKGAVANQRDKKGLTALDFARKSGKKNNVKALLGK